MAYDADYSASERLRRSEERLRELYRDESSDGRRLPKIPGMGLLLLLLVVFLIIFSATILFKYNHFVALQHDVFANGSHLEAVFQRRVNLFDNLLKLTLNHAALEHEVFNHVANVRKEIIKELKLPPALEKQLQADFAKRADTPIDLKDIQGVMQQLDSSGLETSMGRLLGIVEQYPNVKSSETYSHLMISIIDIENRIADRRMAYQEAIRAFNMEISRFPWYIFAHITGFVRFSYFEAESGAHYRPNMTADLFEQLLPLTESNKMPEITETATPVAEPVIARPKQQTARPNAADAATMPVTLPETGPLVTPNEENR
ncbi:MAG: LemA family protein [Gammaproteobacteria bacterium]|nr:LemA family protein [Gammaproteobacteria bacterium]